MPNSVRVCRDTPARCARVQVSESEGRATHAGPESCAGPGNGVREALTGEWTGRVSSPEIGPVLGADALLTRGRRYRQPRFGEGQADPAGSETSSRHRHTVCGTREALHLAWASWPGPHGKPARGTAVMHGGRESASSIRPRRQPNNVCVENRHTRRRLWREGSWPRGRRLSNTGSGRSAGVPCTVRSTGYVPRRGGTA
jgi:hypothetical protein